MPKSIHRSEYEILRRSLREHRLKAGLTQSELSDQLGRSQSFVSDVERGVRRLDVVELRDICQLLGVNFIAFLQDLEVRLVGRRTSGQARKVK